MEVESMVLLEVLSMNFILGISKEMNWKVEVVFVEVSLRNLVLRIRREINWKEKVV